MRLDLNTLWRKLSRIYGVWEAYEIEVGYTTEGLIDLFVPFAETVITNTRILYLYLCPRRFWKDEIVRAKNKPFGLWKGGGPYGADRNPDQIPFLVPA
jgi:hypothetical protein